MWGEGGGLCQIPWSGVWTLETNCFGVMNCSTEMLQVYLLVSGDYGKRCHLQPSVIAGQEVSRGHFIAFIVYLECVAITGISHSGDQHSCQTRSQTHSSSCSDSVHFVNCE